MDKKSSLILVLSTLLVLYSSTLFANQSPIIDSLEGNPQNVLPGGASTVTLSAHDPDCPDTCTSGCGMYIKASSTEWEASGGTISDISLGSNESPYTSSITWTAPTSTGCYTINVTIWDNSGMLCFDPSLEATASISLSVGAGSPPIISSILAEPHTIFLGKNSVITAAVSDPDGDSLTYSWSAAEGTISGADDEDPEVITWTAPGVGGTYNIVLTVSDGVGCEVARSINISVVMATYLNTFFEEAGKPARIATDRWGKIFISYPREGRIRVYDIYGNPIFTIENLGRPVAVSVDADGERIYVGDEIYGRVSVFDSSGNFLFRLGSGDGQFKRPQDIAVDPLTNAIYVTDGGDHQVKVFDPDGTYSHSFGEYGTGDGQLIFPTGIAVDQLEGEVFVSDFGNGRIQVFDTWGGWKASLGEYGSGQGEFTRPQGLSLDENGRIYVVDAFQSSVQVLDRQGNHIAFIGGYGAEPGQLRTPLDAAIDSYGRLLVTSTYNSRVEVFALESYQGVPEPIIPEVPKREFTTPKAQSTGCGCQHISPSEGGISSEGVLNLLIFFLPLFLLFLRRRARRLYLGFASLSISGTKKPRLSTILGGRLFLGLIFLSILLLSTPARALDAPHNQTTTILSEGMHCGTCHMPHNSLGGPYNLSDSAVVNLCISCHNGTTATAVTIHSSTETSTTYGTWERICTDCHNPHSHDQYSACEGAGNCDTTVFRDLGGGDTTSTSTTITTATLTESGRTWAIDQWIGYSLVANTTVTSPSVFKITDSGTDWVQVNVSTTLDLLDVANAGDTYAIFYGKLVSRVDFSTSPSTVGRINGAGGWTDIKFYDNSGPFSFSDNTDPWSDEVCNTCHSQTKYHQYDGTATVDQSHYDGNNCTTACHRHDSGFKGAGDCIGCHSTAGARRQIVENGGSGGDFNRMSHHVTDPINGPSSEIVTKYDCVVCHSEGNADGGMNATYHGNNRVDLKDADDGSNIRLPLTPPYNGSTLTTFCLTCHDSDGAQFTYVPAEYGGNDDPLRPYNTTDSNTVLDVKSQFTITNYSSHAISVLGVSKYSCGGSGINAAAFVSPWQDCSMVECGDCHYVDNNAHGTLNNKWLLEDSSESDTAMTDATLNCFKCHTYSVYEGGTADTVFVQHGTGQHQDSGANSFGNWCMNCHGGGNGRAGSIHGTNQSTTDDGSLGSYKEYRFLNGAGLDYWENPNTGANKSGICSTWDGAVPNGNNITCSKHASTDFTPNYTRPWPP